MKKRLDEELVERRLVKDKKEAFIIVTEGRVLVNGQKAVSPSQLVNPDAKIEIRPAPEYVGRAALKLEAALKKFKPDLKNKIAADIGSAAGGFTEVLLKNGVKKVYAIDTARGKLAPRLRSDPRVEVKEGVDARDLKKLPEPAEIATIDVSLVPLRQILPAVKNFLSKTGRVIALFKPQYETRDPRILRHGVIKDAEAREKLLADFQKWLKENDWTILDEIESPIRGSEGNIEYLLYLKC